ncbi:MAG: hypothetical protein KAH18_10670 [Psychromonas sp.]|nr:hypothetical protein [Psychromonas sp.]
MSIESDYNVVGTAGRAITSRGRLVKVWKPAEGNSINNKYFCNRLSLDPYRRYGYSVCSGSYILKALEDEYVEIGVGPTRQNAISGVILGDIVSFSNLNEVIIHTAVVINVPVFIQRLTEQNIFETLMVWIKNGTRLECVQSLLITRCRDIHAPTMRYWRAR